MNFDNEIILNGNFGTNGLALTEKVEKSIRTGVELDAIYQIDRHFTLRNNSSFNYSRIKEQDIAFMPMLTPKFIIIQDVIYFNGNISVTLSGRYQSQSYIDFANSETVKGYCLLNARANYQWDNLLFGIHAYNLTNTRYFNHGYVDFV
jgi:iron complex outermembrane receptor protein